MKWPPEHDARLKELNLRGWNARQIGAVLGRTRNSVIGRSHRLRMANQPPAGRSHRPRAHRKPRAPREPSSPQYGQPSPPRLTASIAPSMALVFVAIDPRDIVGVTGCLWPVGWNETAIGRHLFCNADRGEAKPYCAAHYVESIRVQ